MSRRRVSPFIVALACLAVAFAVATQASAATCGTAWAANVAYTAGNIVSYGGHNYSCLQSHTSLTGWEPPNVPALWTDQGACTAGGATATATSRPTATATATTARATATATTARATATATTVRATATATTVRATATATTARATATATATTARATATATTAPGSVNLSRALYIMPFNNPIPIQTYINETGLKSYMISFILSNGGCTALWDGAQPLNSATVSNMISTIRSNGGDVAISQGGYAGTKLGQACSDGTAAYNALNAAVSMYSIKAVDFDIEEPEIESIGDPDACATNNAFAVCRELDAAKLFAQAGKSVSITMPTTPTGLSYYGGLTAKAMKNKGLCTLSNVHVRIMPFDGGFTQPSGTESAAQGLHDQMMTYCGWDSATSWARIGISGMNGRSDTGEFTSLQNWKDIITWVNSKGMPDLTTWAQQRDRPCTPIYGQVDPGTKGDCSSVTDAEGAFGAAMK